MILGPDSKFSYEAWLNVRRSLSLQQNKVKLTFNHNPLPYHFYATYIHQAFFYVLKNGGTTDAENFMTYVFGKQDQYTEEAHLNKTAVQFGQWLAEDIGKAFVNLL